MPNSRSFGTAVSFTSKDFLGVVDLNGARTSALRAEFDTVLLRDALEVLHRGDAELAATETMPAGLAA